MLTETFLLPRFFSGNVRVKQGDVVFDLGASIGTTMLVFSKYVGDTGRVFAVEPLTHKVIQKNIQVNHLENDVATSVATASYPIFGAPRRASQATK